MYPLHSMLVPCLGSTSGTMIIACCAQGVILKQEQPLKRKLFRIHECSSQRSDMSLPEPHACTHYISSSLKNAPADVPQASASRNKIPATYIKFPTRSIVINFPANHVRIIWRLSSRATDEGAQRAFKTCESRFPSASRSSYQALLQPFSILGLEKTGEMTSSRLSEKICSG